MKAVVSWQAPLPTGIAHAWLALHPGYAPVCGAPVVAVAPRFEYPTVARCTKCEAYVDASVAGRLRMTHR